MNETTCECSEEYGPCEDHVNVLAQRAGSSNRTADELCLVFLEDAEAILRDNDMADVADKVHDKYNDYVLADAGWLEDPDMAQGLHDDVSMVETWLPEGVMVWWEDGYVIGILTDDCPLYETGDDK